MPDPRIAEHAKILVNHSCTVGRGEFVLVMGSAEAVPLMREIASEVGRVGGDINILLLNDSVLRAYLMAADDETIGITPKPLVAAIEASDAVIQIMATSNTKEMSDVPPGKMMVMNRAISPVMLAAEKKKWNITLHPTEALAQEADMSLEAFADFVYGTILIDWPAIVKEMQGLAEMMRRTRMVRILGKETDISFSIEGRTPIVDGGENNLPGGEVYTSPVHESVNGSVYFDKPIIYQGSDINGVRLVFRDGVIIEHSAESGGDLLDSMLKVDEGASRLGELGIGMNRRITRFSKNILFDEKMGDTIHMAVGLSFKEAGGTNASAIHIDMIKDMKDGGTIYFDQKPVYAEGRFVWE